MMIVPGAVLGANSGFVAVCHVARLMILNGLIPLNPAADGQGFLTGTP